MPNLSTLSSNQNSRVKKYNTKNPTHVFQVSDSPPNSLRTHPSIHSPVNTYHPRCPCPHPNHPPPFLGPSPYPGGDPPPGALPVDVGLYGVFVALGTLDVEIVRVVAVVKVITVKPWDGTKEAVTGETEEAMPLLSSEGKGEGGPP